MAGKAAVAVVARHELVAANRGVSSATRWAFTAGDDGRNNDRPAKPLLCFLAGGNNLTGGLVSQHERQSMAGGNAIVCKADVSVADAAAGHFYNDFILAWLQRR